MGSPFLQKLRKSPLAPKTPLLRNLTVGSKLASGGGKVHSLSPDVCRNSYGPVAKDGLFRSPPLGGVRNALSPVRLCSTSKFSSSVQRFHRQPPSYSPNFGNSGFVKSREDFQDSPAVALQFSATHSCEALIQSPCRIAKYTNERKKLYHQDSPNEASWSGRRPEALVSGSSVVGCQLQSPPDSSDHRPDREVFVIRKGSVGSATGYETPKSTPKLGKGGFGTVFIGKYDGKLVAIKQLYNRKKKDRSQEESFCAELNAFRLNHPNIVRILAFSSCGFAEQVVFEYVGPKNLQQILDDVEGENVDVDRRYRYSSELAEALRYCHSRRILHLDVKATNVMLTEEGDHCKLADFGCSRVLQIGADHLPETPPLSSNAGTLMFKAPELLKGLPASAKADVYSYGYVVWQCLSRKLPFEGYHPHTVVFCVVSKGLRPDCGKLNLESCRDQVLLQLASKCWQDDPEQRPTFVQICDTILSGIML